MPKKHVILDDNVRVMFQKAKGYILQTYPDAKVNNDNIIMQHILDYFLKKNGVK